MLRNYLTVAFRNLIRYRVYAAINIAGLAVGMTLCILIGLYIQHQMSFDRHHERADQIYRVFSKAKRGKMALTGGQLAPTAEEEIHGVERAARVF